jgi:hypothetical protein
VPKAIFRDDFWGAKVLELGRVGASLRCQPDQIQSPLQAAVMIGRNICNKIGRVACTNQRFPDS